MRTEWTKRSEFRGRLQGPTPSRSWELFQLIIMGLVIGVILGLTLGFLVSCREEAAAATPSVTMGEASIAYADPPILQVWVTGYTQEEGFTTEGTTTSNGTPPGWGTCAVDPTVIPYGSVLYVPAYADLCGRYAIALDSGSAVKGLHVDVWTEFNFQAFALTGWHKIKVLRWGWNDWTCYKAAWGL